MVRYLYLKNAEKMQREIISQYFRIWAPNYEYIDFAKWEILAANLKIRLFLQIIFWLLQLLNETLLDEARTE